LDGQIILAVTFCRAGNKMVFVSAQGDLSVFQFGRRAGNQGVVERRSGHWRGVNIIQLSEHVENPPEELVAASANVERPVRI
jgi:hypothetical protein